MNKFIHLNKYSLITSYIPNILPLASDISMNRTKIPALRESISIAGRPMVTDIINKQISHIVYQKVIITKEKEKAELSKEYQDVCICLWWIFTLNKVVKGGPNWEGNIKVSSNSQKTTQAKQVIETKTKINKWDLMKLKSFAQQNHHKQNNLWAGRKYL